MSNGRATYRSTTQNKFHRLNICVRSSLEFVFLPRESHNKLKKVAIDFDEKKRKSEQKSKYGENSSTSKNRENPNRNVKKLKFHSKNSIFYIKQHEDG